MTVTVRGIETSTDSIGKFRSNSNGNGNNNNYNEPFFIGYDKVENKTNSNCEGKSDSSSNMIRYSDSKSTVREGITLTVIVRVTVKVTKRVIVKVTTSCPSAVDLFHQLKF